MTESICVVGLGRLGLPMAAALAARGFQVIGADVDAERVQAVNEHRAPFYEPGLQTYLTRAGGRLTATTNTRAAVANATAVIVFVPSPCEAGGAFSSRFVADACREIGAALADGALVMVRTTVMPGTVGTVAREALEAGGKVAGRDFSLVYSPEFLALGSVIRDFLNPAFVLIGADDARAAEQAESLYRVACENEPRVVHTNIVNAEIAKLCLNVALMLKITYANHVARLCGALPGADCDAVAGVLGADPRIGPALLRGGMAWGGTCFPRDLRAMGALCEGLGVSGELVAAMGSENDHEKGLLCRRVEGATPDGATVAIMGLSFKPDVPEAEGSSGAYLRTMLKRPTLVYDPLLAPGSAQDVADRAATVVVTHPDKRYRALRFHAGQTVIDCWRVLDGEQVRADGARYVALGVGE